MASAAERRSFLLSITLTELSFIMFFLLMIISAATLHNTKKKLNEETQRKTSLLADLNNAKQDHNKTFKRLQLLEAGLMQAGSFSTKPNAQQLNELFSRLQEVKPEGALAQMNLENYRLQEELKGLQQYRRLASLLEDKNNFNQKGEPQTVEQLLDTIESVQKDRELLKGRVTYMQNRLRGNGLDHPPCWANSKTGAIEYLLTITLFEQKMSITAAWPKHREKDSELIPGLQQLVGKSVTQAQFKQQVQPIFSWSKAHECRHFVQIIDDQETSKEAFKQQLFAIEAYFYKYLQH